MAGCGSSSEDFVVTGNNNPIPGGPGSLTFQFVKAQAAVVPTNTTAIQFEYLNVNDGLISTETEPFATSITVVPPTGTTSVRITALATNGFPLGQAVGDVPVPPTGTNVTVNMGGFIFTDITFTALNVTPATANLTAGTQTGNTQQLTLSAAFSNGENIVFGAALLADADYLSSNTAAATVNGTGLVSSVAAGTATVTVSYADTEGTTRSDTVDVTVTGGVVIPDTFVVTPDPLEIPIGGTSSAVTATYTPGGGTATVVPNANVTFGIDTVGFTANANGTVTVDGSVADGTTATLTASFTDGDGDVNTDTITVMANTAVITSRDFATPTGDVSLPYSIAFQLAVSETFDNGNTMAVADLVAAGYSFGLTNSVTGTTNATITPGGLLNTGTSQGTATVNLIFNAQTVDSFTLTVDPAVVVSAIEVSPADFELTPGQTGNYTVLADFQNGPQDLDVTLSPAVQDNSNNTTDATFNLGVATGGTILGGTSTTYTFTLGAANDTVDVVSALGFIQSLDITVGGQATGNVPLLLDGVVEVTANFTDGRSQPLRPSQFTVQDPGANGVFSVVGNVLEPGANAALGSAGVFLIDVTDTNYPDSDLFTVGNSFTATYVSAGGASTATAGFRHYPDVNAVFNAKNINTQVTANLIPRSLDLLFSNDEVTNFRVAASNTVESVNYLTVNTDIFGYPCLISDRNATQTGPYAATTIQIVDSNAALVKSASFGAVRVWNLNALASNSTNGQTFLPSSQAISVGQSDSFDYFVDARDGDTETFLMTDELFFTPSNLGHARSLVEMGQLVVTALSTSGAASQNVTVQASTLVGQNRPGSTLNITVTAP
jgi:hypothetical protein